MAKFNSYIAASVGKAGANVLAAPDGAASVLIGCNVANLTAGTITASVVIKRGADTVNVRRNFRVAAGESAELLTGRIVLRPGDVVRAEAQQDGACDVIASLLENA